MSDLAIRVEGLSKQYRIGRAQGRHDTLRDALAAGLRAPFQRLSSILQPPSSNLHLPSPNLQPPSSDTIWALKDVSFEVQRGEVLGIIGRNGAGKSTLLKVLSRITEPTEGRAEIHGRVGSLLEVGTGFHPELTGRENIYLNGAILGMRKAEIEHRFDEIVAFSEIEKFLDTPVKRYSSGMYVRLAFAVAAHLEPEILLVDEVLAVGDAAFQKKCLGKMGDVARGGRTVLFVSHNMAAVRGLCYRALLLQDGRLALESDAESVIRSYLSQGGTMDARIGWDEEHAPQSAELRFVEAAILDETGEPISLIDIRKPFWISVEYEIKVPLRGLRIGFFMQTLDGTPISGSNDPEAWASPVRGPGRYVSRCKFPGHTLNQGVYSVFFGADIPPYSAPLVSTPYCLRFEVQDVLGHGPFRERLPGVLRPALVWTVAALEETASVW